MTCRHVTIGSALCGFLVLLGLPGGIWADEPAAEAPAQSQSDAKPATEEGGARVKAPSQKRAATRRRDATLEEVLKFAKDAYAEIDENITDYTCVLYKREYVDGEVSSWQKMSVKIRHEQRKNGEIKVPFSVYLRFSSPVPGRAVLYVQNQNNGDMIARRGGSRSPNMTLRLDPEGSMAMDGNRYPITEIGFKNLAKRLIEVLEQEMEYRDGEIHVWENAHIEDRKCTHFRLTHRTKRPNLTYHMAEVTVDDELGVPIRYRAFDFPKEEGGEPQLLEHYAYTDVRINVGLTDEDFDYRNPSYGFQLHETGDQEEPVAETASADK